MPVLIVGEYEFVPVVQEKTFRVLGPFEENLLSFGVAVDEGSVKRPVLAVPTADSFGGPGVKSVKAELSRLNEPLARLFGQFKRRIERLPTRAQRRDAGKQELSEPADARG